MTAIREFMKVKDNTIKINLPDEFKDKEVEVIVLPKEEEYEFWSDEEIDNLGKIGFVSSSFEDDEEDYSKW